MGFGKTLKATLAPFAMAAALLGAAAAQAKDDFGVLVMAHGGGPKWNGEVEASLAPLRAGYPLEIAFGMADAVSLQAAVQRLEAKGVKRVAVVRLFVSGESWYERTEQILGLKPGAPPKPAADPHAGHGGTHAGHSMEFWRVGTTASFALSKEGLAEASEMGLVLGQRALALSQEPTKESVLILAHGPEDDAENARWLAQIDARAEGVRRAAPFRQVQVESLREDWPEKRKISEVRIRTFVEQAAKDGGRAIVIPYRVAGFGPYAKVLEGLTYASDGQGLLPSPEVASWVRRQAETLKSGTFQQSRMSEPTRTPR